MTVVMELRYLVERPTMSNTQVMLDSKLLLTSLPTVTLSRSHSTFYYLRRSEKYLRSGLLALQEIERARAHDYESVRARSASDDRNVGE